MAWRWFKRFLWTAAILAVLLMGAVTAALYLVDTEALKNQLESRVEAQTGRELQVDGPLQISVFPWLGFEIGGARLANAPGFGEQPFVAIDRAQLRARLLPLLRREIVLDTVVLRGLEVNAARDAQGQTNWADLAAPEGSPETQGEPPAEAPPPDESDADSPAQGGEPLTLRIGGVEVRNARITWDDAASETRLVISDLGLTMGALSPERSTPVDLAGTVTRDDGLALAVEASTSLRFDLEAPSAALENLSLDVTNQGALLPAGATLHLETDLLVDAAAGTAALEQLSIRALDTVSAEGTVRVRYGNEPPAFEGRLSVAPFSPAELAQAGGWELPARADPSTLRQASLALDFSGTADAVAADPLEATIDDTDISGHVRAALGERPAIDFALAANAIDLDRYLPDAEAGAEDDDGGAAEEGAGAPSDGDPIADLPLEAMQDVDGKGRLTIDRLQWRSIPAEEVRLAANLSGGVLDITEANMRVAGGRVGASGQLNASDAARPAVRLQTELAEVRSQPLLTALTDSAPVTGALNANAALTTAGATLDDWIGALDGNFSARFTDGAIQGINIAQRLRMAAARLRGDEFSQASESRSTDFSSLQLSATITEGIARSDDLDLRTPLLRVGGEGWADLGRRTLDYTARILVTGTLEGQGGASGAELRGAEIPLHFSGDLTSPEIDLALAEVFQERARERVEQEGEEAEQRAREEAEEAGERIEEEVEEAGDRIEEEVRDRLEGLFE